MSLRDVVGGAVALRSTEETRRPGGTRPCSIRRRTRRVRAMYTDPLHVRKGVGRLILSLCEEAARREGFSRVELMATMAGEPLYRACGYEALERIEDDRGGVPVPMVRMGKAL